MFGFNLLPPPVSQKTCWISQHFIININKAFTSLKEYTETTGQFQTHFQLLSNKLSPHSENLIFNNLIL